jgi:hypothetical protein
LLATFDSLAHATHGQGAIGIVGKGILPQSFVEDIVPSFAVANTMYYFLGHLWYCLTVTDIKVHLFFIYLYFGASLESCTLQRLLICQ